MLVFLDTEFTDFIDCELISIGIVSEDGQHVFYAERNDYRREWESDFVRLAVLPQLGQQPAAICNRDELQTRLWAWFESLPGRVQIACDSQHDQDLLWDAFGEGLPENLDPKRFDLATLSNTAAFHAAVCDYHAKQGSWHHALHDAQAHRSGWLAWKGQHTSALSAVELTPCCGFIKLSAAGNAYVSRAEAKDLLSEFEAYDQVEVDFEGVEEIGASFADELVRVFPLSHPAAQLTIVNASSKVLQMLKRSQSRADLPQPPKPVFYF
ncbi:DUF4325 domain-containing protein [Niveibacterium sp. 24ML]|uniref:STAS-like domain-containing protein n=1 Tax=Niveibacterium sp. 24ML TaxID=2985512 RepID=UPI00226E8F38|nr:DUF4325 domain-containing protein [Niveibacterium sp. 24ML]MCX9156489.1 DUF4325 domain-containing protein [Niveibacterium sp. 24ML]